jgi:hypothetical protein
MSATPDNVEELLSEIRNTILENRKFLQNLEEENDNDELEPENIAVPKEDDEADEFEEL